MIPTGRQNPIFRFAPSPNGSLHLGHALSAMLNADMARASGGQFLLRMEDIDIARCKPEYETAIEDDLKWLGLDWQQPVRRQSQHLDAYRAALDSLIEGGLAYPAFMSRGEVKARVSESEKAGRAWSRDPDGAPHYPPDDRHLSPDERERRIARGDKHAWRLDVEAAVAAIGADLDFHETGDGPAGRIKADPLAWGDVVLWRSDAPSSYHLSVAVDDALQGITHVVRGLDLFAATSIHRLLQELLGLPSPVYHHHRLIRAQDGHKLSKSNGDTGLAELRARGLTSADIRRLVGL